MPGVLYIGDYGGWFHKSSNYGQDWTEVNINPTNPAPMQEITVDPNQHDRIYAAQAGYDLITGLAHGGLYLSQDGGDTWAATSLLGIPVNVVKATSSADGTVVYAGVGDYRNGTVAGGIYRSDDDGQSWLQAGLGDKIVNAISIHPENPDILYAGTVRENFDPDSARPVYRSLDGGDNWEQLSLANCGGVETIAIDPNNPEIIFVSAGNQLHKSIDGGDHWFLYHEGRPGEQFQSIYIPKPFDNSMTTIYPSFVLPSTVPNVRLIYLGTSMGLYRRYGADYFLYLPIIISGY
jgi:photosystem II stability/assembly factor-like uncharacterized protein